MRAGTRATGIVGAMLLVAVGIAQSGGAVGGGLGGSTGGYFGGPSARDDVPRPEKPVWLCIGPAAVEEGQEIGGLVALGPVTIAGNVRGDVTSFGGDIAVRKTGVIAGDVTAVCADINIAKGAQVEGAVQARQLPDMASVDVGWPGPDGMRIIFGDAEIRPGDGPIGPRVVIGGNVTVRGGAKVSEIAAVGGDVTIADGADVDAVRIVGGSLQRPGGEPTAKDEIIESFTVTCEGPLGQDPGAPAAAWTTSTVDYRRESMTVSTPPGSDWQRRVRLAFTNESWSMAVDARIAAVVRQAAPEPEKAGEFQRYPAWTGWPLYVPADSDPAFANSAAVGVGLYIGVSQAVSQEGSQRSASRTVSVAVPASAKTLIEGFGGYDGPLGRGYGSFGSSYGRGGFGGVGGTSAGGGRW